MHKRFALLASFVLVSGLSCGGETDNRPVVVVTVTGIPDDVKTLRAAATLNGVKAAQAEEFEKKSATATFGMRLPDGAKGQYVLDLEGLQPDRCVSARGQGVKALSEGGRVDLTVALSALSPRECNGVQQFPLKVSKGGDGAGTLVSEPAGIDCGSKCSAEFGKGQKVKLTPRADAVSRFAGFGGACQGLSSCEVTINGATEVTATFSRKICSAAGFCWENPLPQGYNSFKVWGTSKDNIWAVGDGGLIFRWDGKAWAQSPSGTTDSLYDIWGSSASDIWAVGNSGQVLHYTGTGWSPVTLNAPQARLYGVWGTAPGNVFGVGYDPSTNQGVIYRSDGQTWTRRATLNGVAFYGVNGTGPTDVWIVGSGARIVKFDGTTFADVPSNFANAARTSLYGVWGATDGTGTVYAVGGDLTTGYYNPVVLQWDRTKWNTVPAISGGGTALKSINLNSVWGVAANDVWTVGGNGAIAHWNGVSWTEVAVETKTAFYGVWGSGKDDVIAVGYGPIYRWDGKSFTSSANTGVTNWLVGIAGTGDAQTGAVYTSGQDGTVLKNDGVSWTRLPDPPTKNSMGAGRGSFIPGIWGTGSDLWIGGDFGTLSYFDGKTWTAQDSKTGTYLWSLYGFGKDDVWASGGGGTILHYSGTAWAPTASGTTRNLRGIWGVNKDDIWAVGDQGTVTRWNGLSWNATTNTGGTANTLFGVWGSAKDEVWAVGGGGVILRFDGNNWQQITSNTTQDLYGVWAVARADAWAVGNGGTVLHWDGINWSKVESGTSFQLWGVWGRGANDLYITGYGGTILRYKK